MEEGLKGSLLDRALCRQYCSTLQPRKATKTKYLETWQVGIPTGCRVSSGVAGTCIGSKRANRIAPSLG